MKKIALDTDYLVREYRAGRSCAHLMYEFDVSRNTIIRRLSGANVDLIGVRKALPVGEIVAAYLSGDSEKALADRYEVTRDAIRRRLRENGVPIRDRREAETVKWSRMTDTQRAAQVSAAHDAVRGVPLTFEKQCRIAQGRQQAGAHRTPTEDALRAMLSERGFDTIPQQAIGPYNCDLGAYPVAVEIFGGEWHWHGHHLLRTPERFRYLLDAGWHILAVKITARRHPLTAATADYVAAYVQQARRDPAARREYRVIRGAGELIVAGSADDDQISIIPTLTSRRDPVDGQYTNVPR